MIRVALAVLIGSVLAVGRARADSYASPAVTPEHLQRALELKRQATLLMKSGHYSEAEKVLDEAIRFNSSDAGAWDDRAIAEIRTKDYSQALYDSSFALGLSPGDGAALDTRAWAFDKLGKYPQALSDSGFVLAKNSLDAFAYEARAFALAGLRDKAGSLSALAEAASLDPLFKGIYARALRSGSEDLVPLFESLDQAPSSEPLLDQLRRQRVFLGLLIFSLIGGILVALGILHVVFYRRGSKKFRYGALPASGRSGSFWSRYEKIGRVGSGGMGIVYEARDRFLERKVAVKKLRDEIKDDPEERRRFISEARLVAGLHHPNIVEIYSIVEEKDDLYLVFEFIRGRTLEKILKDGGRMDFPSACAILRSVAKAVDYAHRHGVVHRDIKPSNIMASDDGLVKVMDFGVARQAKATLAKTQTKALAGTPIYMAPEAEDEVPRRESDVFSLGICFFEMLSGRLPFKGERNGMILDKTGGRHIRFSDLGIAGVPGGLDGIFDKALAPDPDGRYHSAAELWAQVSALQS